MNLKWHEHRQERWEQEQVAARRFLKDVQSGLDAEGYAYVDGSFSFESEHGHRSDEFRLRIVYPANFPERGGQPNVYLLSHRRRWRTGRDSHIDEDWRLCLYVGMESTIDFESADSFGKLLACVASFLAREEVYQDAWADEARSGRPPVWPGPARAHGLAGLLEVIAEHGEPRRNDPCVCGSGKKYKNCHFDELRVRQQQEFMAEYSKRTAERGREA